MRLVEEMRHPTGAPAAFAEAALVADGGAGLVVSALRLATGPGCWPLVERGFRDVCGAARGKAASCVFRVLLQGLALGARRPLRLGFLGAPGISPDERSLLQMIAAAQHGELFLVEASARWLVRPSAAGSVARAAVHFAELLAADGARVTSDLPADAVQRPPSARIAAAGS